MVRDSHTIDVFLHRRCHNHAINIHHTVRPTGIVHTVYRIIIVRRASVRRVIGELIFFSQVFQTFLVITLIIVIYITRGDDDSTDLRTVKQAINVFSTVVCELLPRRCTR